jgi:hypothetical protein
MKYQRKPVIVDAFRWGTDPEPSWWKEVSDGFERQFGAGTVFVPIAGGTLQCLPGNWIIREPEGSLTVTDHETFEASYGKVKLDEPKRNDKPASKPAASKDDKPATDNKPE